MRPQIRLACPNDPPVVAIGASLGGVEPLLQVVASLPPDFPAVVAVVLHVGTQSSILPELLQRAGRLPAGAAVHDQGLVPGTVLVAPPDRHLLLLPGRVHLSHGPRENHTRPAIDPLFRSVALGWGRRAIGVVLTGQLDDGTAGLAAIKACGGTAVVQKPQEAPAPSMPASALANVDVEHCVPVAQIGPLLARLVRGVAAALPLPPDSLLRQQAIINGENPMDPLSAIASPAPLTCPECGGALAELNDRRPLRCRCRTGHAYTALSRRAAQQEQADQKLQATVRGLREREMQLRRMAAVAQSLGEETQARAGREQAERVREQALRLATLAEGGGA